MSTSLLLTAPHSTSYCTHTRYCKKLFRMDYYNQVLEKISPSLRGEVAMYVQTRTEMRQHTKCLYGWGVG